MSKSLSVRMIIYNRAKYVVAIFLLLCLMYSGFAQTIRLALPSGHTVPVIKKEEFNQDEMYLASLDMNHNLYVWHVQSTAVVKGFGDVSGFKWSVDSEEILISSRNNLLLYHIQFDKIDTLHTFSGSIKEIVVSTDDGSILIFDDQSRIYKKKRLRENWEQKEIPGFNVNSTYEIDPYGAKLAFVTGGKVKFWDLLQNTEIFTVNGSTDLIRFSRNSKRVALGNRFEKNGDDAQYGIEVIDLLNGNIQSDFTPHINGRINDVSFSGDGQFLASVGNDYSLQVHEVYSRKMIYRYEFEDHELAIACEFNQINNEILVSTTSDLYLFSGKEFKNKKILQRYKNLHVNRFQRPKIADSGRWLVSCDGTVLKLFAGDSWRTQRELRNHAEATVRSKISPTGEYLVTLSSDQYFRGAHYTYNVLVQDLKTGKLIATFDESNRTSDFSFSEDGSLLLVYSYYQEPVRVYDLGNLTLKGEFPITDGYIEFARLSPDNSYLAFGTSDSVVSIFELTQMGEIGTFKCQNGIPIEGEFILETKELVVLSSSSTLYKYAPGIHRVISERAIDFNLPQDDWDGMDVHPSEDFLLAYDNLSGAIMLYNMYSEQMVLAWYEENPCNVHFSKNGDSIISGLNVYAVDWRKLYENINGGKWPIEHVDSIIFNGYTSDCPLVKFSPSGKFSFRSMSRNNGTIADSTKISKQITGHFTGITEASFSPDDKVLVTSGEDGATRFWDVQNGELLLTQYFFDGSPNQWLITDPNGYFDATDEAMSLLHWIINGEVVSFNQLKKEFWVPGLWDLRLNPSVNNQRNTIQTIGLHPSITDLKISNDSVLVKVERREGGYGPISLYVNNKELAYDIRTKDFDETATEQWVNWKIDSSVLGSGSNTFTVYCMNAAETMRSKGGRTTSTSAQLLDSIVPKFFGVVVGVSAYKDSSMNLTFPGKDAKTILRAIDLAAGNLFGQENTYLRILSSDTGMAPMKSKITAVFDTITSLAGPEDVVFVYLSGHGVADKEVNGEFHFLTEEATSMKIGDLIEDGQTTNFSLSGSDWIRLINKVKAQKQFMVIDACGAGKAVDNMSQQKGIRASQIKAIDRMRDRTGMFVLSGCAADAVSYESSVYGQGVLTYAVLEAMRGAALQKEGEVDVQSVMMYARERVPELAKDIGAIQEPQCLFSSGGSFPVGIITEDDQRLITLADPKPVFVNAMILNSSTIRDDLGLSKKMNLILSQNSGEKYLYFPVEQYPGSIAITGLYSTKDKKIELRLVWSKDQKEFSETLSSKTLESLTTKLEEWLKEQQF